MSRRMFVLQAADVFEVKTALYQAVGTNEAVGYYAYVACEIDFVLLSCRQCKTMLLYFVLVLYSKKAVKNSAKFIVIWLT